MRMCISKQITDDTFEGIWHLTELYIFEQRGSNLSKMRAACQ